jgi:DNA-binding transcriptional MerR regulator
VTGGTLGIGDLAQRTGVPVRTIRFYCDEGLLTPARSTGGHRRFDASAVDRLHLVRRLRGLGLGLRVITDVLDGNQSLADAVTAERAALDREVATLTWRRAVLRAVEEAPGRADLLSVVADGFAAHDRLVRLWRPVAGPLRSAAADMFLDVSAPPPPELPTPAQVVAYAELVRLADRTLATQLSASTLVGHRRIDDLGVACQLAAPQVGSRPQPGLALDRFVAAHATAANTSDSPEFRRELDRRATADRHPRVRRYWRLADEVTGAPVGVAHTWLLDALHDSVS